MRIGIYYHTADEFLSGVEYYALGLMNGLFSVDHRNHYVVFTNSSRTLRRHVVLPSNVRLRPHDYLKSRSMRVLWEQFRLPALAKAERLDVLHCPTYVGPVVLRTVPWIITVHDTIAIDHPAWCRTANAVYYGLLLRRSIRRAAAVVAVSRTTANDVAEHVGDHRGKIRVIYPGIDPIFRDVPDSAHLEQARARYKLPDRYILAVGNLEPKKNLHGLLHAHALLQQRGMPQKLVLTGRRSWKAGPMMQELRTKVDQGAVVLAGYVDRCDLPSVYRMADAVVQASWYEGFGFPPLEAMACQVPVVSSMQGALAEISGAASCPIDPRDAASIAAGIEAVITDAAVRRKHIEAGMRESRRYDWLETASQVLQVYSQVVA